MPPESARRQPSSTCDHPGGCGHEAAEMETFGGNPAGTLAGRPGSQKGSRWDSLKRWVLWFLAFFGIYASSSVCPFCGTPGCPVGVGGAVLVGGVFACLWQYGKSAWVKSTGFAAKIFR